MHDYSCLCHKRRYRRAPEKEAAAQPSDPQRRDTSVLSGRLWGDCFPPNAGQPVSTQMSSWGDACGGDDGAQADPGLGRM